MDGYIIEFVDAVGDVDTTFFGDFFSSFDDDPFPEQSFSDLDPAELVRIFFCNAHPECKILEMRRGSLADFESLSE